MRAGQAGTGWAAGRQLAGEVVPARPQAAWAPEWRGGEGRGGAASCI